LNRSPQYSSAETPWIGVDLDGTLAEHYWPHKGPFHPLIIGSPIVPMVQEVRRMLAEGYVVKVFTARVGVRGKSPNNKGVKLEDIRREIARWTEEHVGTALEATCVKDYNMVQLWDDRAVRVVHNGGTRCCD